VLTCVCLHDFTGHRRNTIWYLQEPNTNLYPVWRLARLGILHIRCVCTTLQPHSMEGLWVEQQQWLLPIELLAYTSEFSSWSTLPSRIVTEANILPAISVLDDSCPDIQVAGKLTYSLYYDDLPWFSAAWRLDRRYNSQCRNDVVQGPIVMIAVMAK